MDARKYKPRPVRTIQKIKTTKVREVHTLKFCGSVKFDEDDLSIQKRLRMEWK